MFNRAVCKDCAEPVKKRTEPHITVKVYFNRNEVTLTVNQDSWISRKKGRNVVKAVRGKWMDENEFYGLEILDQSYICVDLNPGLNLKNWSIDVIEGVKM